MRRLVCVRWRDAWFEREGSPIGEETDYLVETVGWVISTTERFFSVAAEILPNDDGYRAVTHIPQSVVETVVGLVERP